MKLGNELETISCIFHNKNTMELKQGELTTDKNGIIEIHFSSGEIHAFKNLKTLFDNFNIGTLPFHEKQLNKFQLIIKKIFNL